MEMGEGAAFVRPCKIGLAVVSANLDSALLAQTLLYRTTSVFLHTITNWAAIEGTTKETVEKKKKKHATTDKQSGIAANCGGRKRFSQSAQDGLKDGYSPKSNKQRQQPLIKFPNHFHRLVSASKRACQTQLHANEKREADERAFCNTDIARHRAALSVKSCNRLAVSRCVPCGGSGLLAREEFKVWRCIRRRFECRRTSGLTLRAP